MSKISAFDANRKVGVKQIRNEEWEGDTGWLDAPEYLAYTEIIRVVIGESHAQGLSPCTRDIREKLLPDHDHTRLGAALKTLEAAATIEPVRRGEITRYVPRTPPVDQFIPYNTLPIAGSRASLTYPTAAMQNRVR